ncbi:type IX secretion system sortase PorU [Persicitalea jodogahamensis]|uniref:Peptidase C25 n=1 Tax=Persicitalea jodogahamensis TaxID=402147 RepID=A0A8J3G7Y2_9BACT|nr:type IX secretion system sortase PorU [Persicitalea jodogahamensis]GHB53148.1 peptidase C25 [Persicitalea jodogahamensis]
MKDESEKFLDRRFCSNLRMLFGWLLLGAALIQPSHAQTTSVLAEGTWYKIAVTQSGVHRVGAGFLRKMGIDPSKLNPGNLQIYGNGGGVLPQNNAAARPIDLLPNAIWVAGEEDGRFDEQDAIYFYAEGPRTIRYDSVQNSFFHEINSYTDSSYYYLKIGASAGKRVADVASQNVGGTPVDQFDDYWFHEEETVNLLQSGREWWGEYLGLSGQLSLKADLPGVVLGSAAILRGAGIATAQVATRFRWQVNGQDIGEQTQGAVSTYRYDLKAQRSEKNYAFVVGSTPPTVFNISLNFDKNGQSNAQAYLDFAALQTRRQLRAYAAQQIYRFRPSGSKTVSYLLKDIPQDWQWWDISNPQQPHRAVLERTTDGTAKFGANDGRSVRTYAGFSPQQTLEPAAWQKIANQNIHALSVPELLIVTPKAWQNEAARLAQFREKHDGLTVVVVTTDQIFNEFASGKPDPTAIRDFARYLYQQNPDRLKYLLLFGDATYDYRNRGGIQSATQQQRWVPVYESRESLHPVYTYSSDDYFGFLQENEGEWRENSAGDHLLDIGIGRLPVKTPEEARVVVDKLIHYTASPQTLGKWRNRISFVADDGDGNIHQQHADLLAKQIGDKFLTQRLFVDAYPHVSSPEGAKVPDLNATIRQRINEGTLILNYTGHGGTTGWAEEQILTLADMQNARGYNNLPLLLTATCEFGRYDDPALVSGAELMVLSPRGAAIGALTTTRPVFSSTNFSLNQAFYEALNAADGTTRLGDLMKSTKNNSLSGSLNRNFALLGDPSMPLARPPYEVTWAAAPDTLSALRQVTLRGSILQNEKVADTFDGKAFVTIYDKPVRFRTNGEGGAVAAYDELRNKLYEGQATVQHGQFALSFVVPRNIDYRFGTGRVSVYALRSDSLADAAAQLDVTVGGAVTEATDRTPPELTAYLNDSTFRDGQTVPANSVLWVKAFDASGISVSSAGLGQDLTATLNDTTTFVLNDYFQAQTDDFRRGRIRFPLDELSPGSYILRVKVWDTYTNSTETTLRFTVGASAGIRLDAADFFPNPFDDQLSFKITHDRPGEDVEITVRLITLSGQVIHTSRQIYYNSEPNITEMLKFGPNNALAFPGRILYLYDLQIRSTKDQTTDRRGGKLLHVR